METRITQMGSVTLTPTTKIQSYRITLALLDDEIDALTLIGGLMILGVKISNSWGEWCTAGKQMQYQLHGDVAEQERVRNGIEQDITRLLKLAKYIKQVMAGDAEVVELEPKLLLEEGASPEIEQQQQGLTAEGLSQIAKYAGLEENNND